MPSELARGRADVPRAAERIEDEFAASACLLDQRLDDRDRLLRGVAARDARRSQQVRPVTEVARARALLVEGDELPLRAPRSAEPDPGLVPDQRRPHAKADRR